MRPTSTSAGVGKSIRRDPLQAGAEAARGAVAGLAGASPALVLAFGTTGYDQQQLLDGVRQVTGDAPLSGCSGEGVITAGDSDERSHAVAVMALAAPGLTARTVQVTGVSKDPAGAAARLAVLVAAGPPATVVLLFADGMTFDCGSFLVELERRLPAPVPLIGGTAGTELGSFSQWVTWQYHDGLAATDAVSAVILGGAVVPELSVNHGCEAMGLELTVTRSDGGSLVSELDGRPAFEVLKEFLDGDAPDLRANEDLHLVVGLPLADGAVAGYGEFLVRAPLRLDPATGAVFFNGGGLTEGCRVQLVRRDVDQMRESAARAGRELAARHPGVAPLAMLQFDCTGRGRVLCGSRTAEIIIDPLRGALGAEVPWIGFHTFGEIAPLRGRTHYHACTAALCALFPAPAGAAP